MATWFLHGPDGKWVVDTFVSPAWPKLEAALGGLGKAPVRFAMDTHWHFDHTDNNAALHASGATVLAHENTKRRMSEPQELEVLGLKFPPSPTAALPQKTFRDRYHLRANGESVALTHVPPAHTDTDVYVHFQESNVLHAGDVFFNGIYPYIDGSTGGNISGMIAGANKILALADDSTKIVPGHGPLGNRADLGQRPLQWGHLRSDRLGNTLASLGRRFRQGLPPRIDCRSRRVSRAGRAAPGADREASDPALTPRREQAVA